MLSDKNGRNTTIWQHSTPECHNIFEDSWTMKSNLMKNVKTAIELHFFPVEKIQYLFSLGLALQHSSVHVCRNLILLTIYFLVVCMIRMNCHFGTCAGSTIKIVFNTYLSNDLPLQTLSMRWSKENVRRKCLLKD